MCTEGGWLYRKAENTVILYICAFLTFLGCVYTIGLGAVHLSTDATRTDAQYLLGFSIVSVIVHVLLCLAIWRRLSITSTVVVFYVANAIFMATAEIVLAVLAVVHSNDRPVKDASKAPFLAPLVLVLVVNIVSVFVYIPYCMIARKRYRTPRTYV
ncbi:hypothetical protein QR680_007896 [Steinernema hermaphroditum]|uniref:MARVEL domain-containing protein n=1 Tax=Steinernema hermaphroditum TaxID=289476 RepID=A0AA39M6N7_9BILA|nr:hypothetical protein QR680_007896 [Steinernema hermaphroditum]